MEKQTYIVTIDLDENSSRVIQAILQEIPGVKVKAEIHDLAKGFDLIKSVNPSIVILNLYPFGEQPVFDIAKKITQNFPEITLFILSGQTDSKVVIRAMHAGAREFLCQPVNKDELITAVKTVIMAKRQSLPDKISKGKIITFFGASGGVGTTTLVTNVATLMAEHTKKDVIVIDLNLQFGSAALFLNMKTKYSILDVANNIDNIDVTLLKTMLPKNSTGVSLLAGPSEIEDAEAITGNHIEQVLTLLKNIFDYIIIDTNRVFDDVTIKALDESENILIVSVLDVPTIYNTKRCLELFKKIGYSREKVLLVINRYSSFLADSDLTAIKEKLLDYPIYWRIPNQDSKSVITSINKGIPISQMMPNSELSQNLIKMIKNFNGAILPEERKTEKSKKLPFLQKIMKQQDK